MALLNGTTSPTVKVYLDAGNRTANKFIFAYSLLGGTDTLGSNAYTPFATLLQLPAADVRSVSIRRGRTREDQTFQAGQLTFIMDNVSGNYDPQKNVATYRGSDGKSILCGSTGVRVTATYSGTETVIYSGYIEQINLVDDFAPTVEFVCTDAITKISKQTFNYKPSWGTEIDADVVTEVLGKIGWPSTFINTTHAGDALVSPELNVTDSAYNICTTIAQMQMGKFFIDRFGKPCLISYSYTQLPDVFMYLSDQRPPQDPYGRPTIEYDNISISGGEKYIVNAITINNTTGDFTRVNGGSVSRYGSIPKSVVGYHKFSADAIDAAVNMANYWGTPEYRIETVEFDGFGLTQWLDILKTELGDGLFLYRQSAYNSTPTLYYCGIESLNHDITASSWRVSMNLSPVPL